MARIAINGFGRIGRLFFRQSFYEKDFQVVAINDLGDRENLAYLLEYDTVYGRFPLAVETREDKLIVGGREIVFLSEKDPGKLPWGSLGTDIVVESTGAFESFEKARAHLVSGAKRVVITAPAKDEEVEDAATVLMGVNEERLKTCVISSTGSCTTNAASPVIQILSDAIGIEKAILNTVHGYTATQAIVDSPVRGTDFRRGRAAAQNIAPSTTGAAIAVTRAIKKLIGKFDGIAMRVPVPTGSVADITFIASRKTSVEEVNHVFRRAARDPRWRGVFKVTEDQVVSSDIIGEPYGAIADLSFTRVVGGNLVKVLSWYDNEAGYTSALIQHVRSVARLL